MPVMKFWNVQVEIYGDGTVKAAVLRSREAKYQPSVSYLKQPGREVFSLWYNSESAAEGAVLEALVMNTKKEAAA
jgi:hypothetical protein